MAGDMIKIKALKSFLLATVKYWQKNWLWYSLGGVIICLGLASYTFRVAWLPESKAGQTVVDQEESSSWRHPLTGQIISEEITRPQVFGVMVENSAEAWPLSGIEEAFLVIEAPVEAKIPRLIAFFSADQTVDQIGPVRSARPYYLDWAGEFDALYAHCGGSPEALSIIQQGNIFDLNEFWNGHYFWRSTNRSAPHNVYTSTEFLNQALKSKTSPELDYGLWPFKNDDPTEFSETRETDLSLNSVEPLYQVTWKYQSENNYYERYKTGGSAITTSSGNQIVANNVAVVYTAIKIIDEVGRREINTIGQGDALVLQDGRIIKTVWKKEAADDRLRFYSEDGKEISWNAGKTWIEIIATTEKNH